MLVSTSARWICTSEVVAISALKHRAHIMMMPRIQKKICQDHRGGNPANEKALLPRIQAGPMAKKYQIGTMIFMALRHLRPDSEGASMLSRKVRTSFWRLIVSSLSLMPRPRQR